MRRETNGTSARWGRRRRRGGGGGGVGAVNPSHLISALGVSARRPTHRLSNDFTNRLDTFMSCDHVDTLLWSARVCFGGGSNRKGECVCVCVFVSGAGEGGGMSGQIPGFRATSGRGAGPGPLAAREIGQRGHSPVRKGGVAWSPSSAKQRRRAIMMATQSDVFFFVFYQLYEFNPC